MITIIINWNTSIYLSIYLSMHMLRWLAISWLGRLGPAWVPFGTMRLFVRDVAGQTLSLQVDGQAQVFGHVAGCSCGTTTIPWLPMTGGWCILMVANGCCWTLMYANWSKKKWCQWMPTDIDGINVVAFFSPKRRGIGRTHVPAELLARYNHLTSSLAVI